MLALQARTATSWRFGNGRPRTSFAAHAPATALAAEPPTPDPRGIPFAIASSTPTSALARRSTSSAARPAVFRAGSVGTFATPSARIVTPGALWTRASMVSPRPVMHSPRASKPGPKLESEAGPKTVIEESGGTRYVGQAGGEGYAVASPMGRRRGVELAVLSYGVPSPEGRGTEPAPDSIRGGGVWRHLQAGDSRLSPARSASRRGGQDILSLDEIAAPQAGQAVAEPALSAVERAPRNDST